MQAIKVLLASAAIICPILAAPAGITAFGEYTGSKCSYNTMTDGSLVMSADTVDSSRDGAHCWTDLVYVKSTFAPGDWTHAGDIDCGSTQTCASGSLNSKQQCTSWSIAVGFKEEVGVELAGTKLGFSMEETVTYENQKCTTATSTNTCTWNDQKCHSTWSSTVQQIDHGYIRRQCNFPGQPKNVTQWSKDLDQTKATDRTEWGCAASCQDSKYPIPPPPVGN